MTLGDLRRKHAPDSQSAHLAGQILLVRARVRAEDHAAMPPLRRAGRALASTTGALLAPRLAATASYVGAGLGIMGALARIGLLAEHCLVYDCHVRGDPENSVIQLNALQLFARQIVYCRLHFITPLPSCWLLVISCW